MEDKRIIKTKQNLKQTLVSLLAQTPFERVTVTELCNAANTSRITFYAHYNDKYELVDDIFKDMLAIATNDFYRLQRENNRENDVITRYCNLLECILNLYYGRQPFFSRDELNKSPYLNFSFFQYIKNYVEMLFNNELKYIEPRYSVKKITGFLCNGIWGFLDASHMENCPIEQVRREATELLRKLFSAEVLASSPAKPAYS